MMTAEEKLMYQVMKAIYDSGIPIDFKGSMVLKACLLEAGYTEEIRHTVDIDANWYSEQAPTAGQMIASLQKALTENGMRIRTWHSSARREWRKPIWRWPTAANAVCRA